MVKYASIKKLDCANGRGIGSSIFFSGCKHNCKGCFNKVAQDFNYGSEFDKEAEDLFLSYIQHPQVNHVSILGGEPMQQDSEVILKLLQRIKAETGKEVWLWSGYTFEELFEMPDKMEILKYVDVLIDGKFELDKKDLKLLYRGSSNQRVIKIQETLKEGKIILMEEAYV